MYYYGPTGPMGWDDIGILCTIFVVVCPLLALCLWLLERSYPWQTPKASTYLRNGLIVGLVLVAFTFVLVAIFAIFGETPHEYTPKLETITR